MRMFGLLRIVGIFAVSMSLSLSAAASGDDPMLFHDDGRLTVRGHLQFGLNAVAEDNLFWDLAAITAPTSDI